MKLTSSLITLVLVFSFSAFAKEAKRTPAKVPSKDKNSTSCETDAVKFCPHESSDGVGNCLKTHETELSDSCRIDLKAKK